MEKELPKGWVETQLIEILETFETGKRPKGGVQGILEGIPSLGGEHLGENGGFKFHKIKFIPESFVEQMNRGRIFDGDILIVKDGATTGKTSYVDENFPYDLAFVNEHVYICRVFKILNSKYVSFFLRSKIGNERILENFTGSAQGGINRKFASNTLIPLPSRAEQDRIVVKVDALLAQHAAIQQAMERIPKLLKDFRQQVLTQAVTGKLTEEWRVGKELEEWGDDIIQNLTSKVGSGSTPKGGSSVYQDSGIPLIRSMNIHFWKIKYDGLAHIDDEKADKLKNVEVCENDVLLNITGASIGRVCLAPKELNGARVNQHVSIIRTNERISPAYLNIFMSSSIIQDYIFNENYGVTRQALTKTQLLNIEINVPPRQEQQEIVRRVELLFEKATAIEQRYEQLKSQIDSLPQAILHKAFKGELVEQLDSDGSAVELLKEIEEMRNLSKNKKR